MDLGSRACELFDLRMLAELDGLRPRERLMTLRMSPVLTREEAIDAAVRRHWNRVDLFWTGACWRICDAPIADIRAEYRKIMAGQSPFLVPHGASLEPGGMMLVDRL